MHFEEHQEKALGRSRAFYFYFALAVLGVVAAVYAFLVLLISPFEGIASWADFNLWRPKMMLWVGLTTSGMIGVDAYLKIKELSKGGWVVAKLLRARPVDFNTKVPEERKLHNVVEEMALAAGIRAPDVYILDSDVHAINAFAVGIEIDDAVVGLTKGAVRYLSRDELQGLIAHEFSHILNGDMRHNTRMIGFLHGMECVAALGRFLDERSGKSNPLAILGIGLVIIGYGGVLVGKLLKLAACRQREFLADASAVQFTRNPEAVAGVLKKIGSMPSGSMISNRNAALYSHMFFNQTINGLLSSHPPLDERITRIEPRWDGQYIQVEVPELRQDLKQERQRVLRQHARPSIPDNIQPMDAQEPALGPVLEAVPKMLLRTLDSPAGAQALFFSLLLPRGEDRNQAKAFAQQFGYPLVPEKIARFDESLDTLTAAEKLALIDRAIPFVKTLCPAEFERFSEIVESLMNWDQHLDLFEFTVHKILWRHVQLFYADRDEPPVEFEHFGEIVEAANVLLSTVVHLGSDDPAETKAAFRIAACDIEFELGGELTFLGREACDYAAIDAALDRFDRSTPAMKTTLLRALTQAAMADNVIRDAEANILRAIADVLGMDAPKFDESVPERLSA